LLVHAVVSAIPWPNSTLPPFKDILAASVELIKVPVISTRVRTIDLPGNL